MGTVVSGCTTARKSMPGFGKGRFMGGMEALDSASLVAHLELPARAWSLTMKKRRLFWVLLLLAFHSVPAQAGVFDFFRRTPKATPVDRVPQLLATVKTDSN